MPKTHEAPQPIDLKEAFLVTLKEGNEIQHPQVWDLLYQISQIPRESKNEGPITTVMEQWAHQQGWITERDKVNNLLTHVPATPGFENAPVTILHFHPDMVCKKEKDAPHDPAVNGVNLIVGKDGWIKADRTSAGFDDGAGLALAFSLATNEPHGRLMLLSTVDEDGDFTGVNNLSFKAIDDADLLINLDNENANEMTVGCAGGNKIYMEIPIKKEPIGDRICLKLTLEGLMGGHSGITIQEKHTNAIKAMAQIARNTIGFAQLVSFTAGETKTVNVIPNEAEMVIAVDPKYLTMVDRLILETVRTIDGNASTDEQAKFQFSQSPLGDNEKLNTMLTGKSTAVVLKAIEDLPHGVSETKDGNIITSSNVAAIATAEKTVIIGMMNRSANEDTLSQMASKVNAMAKIIDATTQSLSKFSPWEPIYDSPLIKLAQTVRQKIKGEPFKIDVTHGGLELGIMVNIWKKLRGMAIALGPTIENPHSTNERMLISSVDETYNLVSAILIEIAKTGLSTN